jgi:hypothetical protein
MYAQADLEYDPLTYASLIAGMTGAHHHVEPLLIEVGSPELFP